MAQVVGHPQKVPLGLLLWLVVVLLVQENP
jgi:hypothetical protein